MLPNPGAKFVASFVSLVLLAFFLFTLAPALPTAAQSQTATGSSSASILGQDSASFRRADLATPLPRPVSEFPGCDAAAVGSVMHTVIKAESLPALVRHYLPNTCYLTIAELEAAIRQANDKKGIFLRPGEQVVIPGIEAAPAVEHPIPVTRDFEVRAVYLTGAMAGSERGVGIIRRWREIGGNAVVFDIKDSDGLLNVPFQHPLAPHNPRPIGDLPKFVRFLHTVGLHAIARIALFRDEHIAQQYGELAVRSRRTGLPWRERGKLVWTDPSRPEVQDYNLELAKWVAQSGVDEVQFDYVRFPAEGDQKDAGFVFQKTHPTWKRSDVISEFLSRAYAELHPVGVLVSLDVFGVMAWQREVDLSHTGQDIPAMARVCDVLSPMIYPSHFFGMEGYAYPGNAPEHFIAESMQRFREVTASSGVVLRPWLQAFAWRTRSYSPRYIEVQVETAKQNGGIGFLFWNARNDYSKPYAAMPMMRNARDRYFRGDELPPKATSGSLQQISIARPVIQPSIR